MSFEQIETLKRQYTDQFVVVDEHRPELARFRGVTGQVKTINMNGRALVEFQDYIANIGWYDIELDFLTVVPKPDPAAAKAATKPVAAKPAATEPAAKAKPAAKAASPSAAPAKAAAAGAKPAAGKMSTAEILAASRAKKAAEAAGSPAETVSAETTAAPSDTVTAPPKSAAKPASGAIGPIGTLKTTAEKIAACRQIDAKKS